ncbi:MAG: hypothetical protein AB4426_11900 [Xenococcaceae cyanobacterium]
MKQIASVMDGKKHMGDYPWGDRSWGRLSQQLLISGGLSDTKSGLTTPFLRELRIREQGTELIRRENLSYK